MLWVAGAISAIAGATEVVSALILGWVVDAAVDSTPQGFFAEHADLLIVFLVFYLVLRPASFGLSSASNSIIVGPNVMPLVLSRLHRWTLGQAVTFFDNDFAGRIAQKQMQAARAVTDVATEMINTVAFALASIIGSVIYLLAIDVWIAAALAVWLAAYVGLIMFFLPRVRENSAARAASRAMVSGQVVDTITNIKTVKLFAHAAYEDRVALDAMEVFRDRSLEFGLISTWFPLCAHDPAGVLPVLLIGGTLLLWQQGQATAGAIAAAGAIAMAHCADVGLGQFHADLDLHQRRRGRGRDEDPDRAAYAGRRARRGRLAAHPGRVAFDHASFAYGRRRAAWPTSTHVKPARSWASWGPRARGNPRSCRCCCGSMTPKRAGFWSTGRTCGTSRKSRCAARSGWSRRKPQCSTARPATTSSTAVPTRPRRR